jgi:restriction system protein
MEDKQIDIKYRDELVGSRNVKVKYFAEIKHKGLSDFKILSSEDEDILESKVQSYTAKLNDKWNRLTSKQFAVRTKEASLKEAELRTVEAAEALKRIENILQHSLEIDDSVNWDLIKKSEEFDVPNPAQNLQDFIDRVPVPKEPKIIALPQKPDQSKYVPKLSFFDKIFSDRRQKKENALHEKYKISLATWEESCRGISLKNQALSRSYELELIKYEKEISVIKDEFDLRIEEWLKEKEIFYKNQKRSNEKFDLLKEKYWSVETAAVIEYCDLVLNNSIYPDSFPRSFELDYNGDTKILILEFSLPSLENIPTLKEVKFIKGELKEYHISDVQREKMFDAAMYNITLRTIHELFEADVANALDTISFNGWVNANNKATGKRENNCILSIQARKTEFIDIDLRHIDPKICFKNLKGVGSSKLSGMTSIKPILQISRADKRFTDSYDVTNTIDSSTNLAGMDWEDFEHLIREVFAKEFNSNGGEVKITQASRDGGVDAIAFDPDPIRGGKIVIQAKRYTNTVGVSAVRDLYGTVMNEGATKGILVTTADYGPDAYEFVKGKPLTLMNGANLLFLLEKHGHKARIDIKEARINRLNS